MFSPPKFPDGWWWIESCNHNQNHEDHSNHNISYWQGEIGTQNKSLTTFKTILIKTDVSIGDKAFPYTFL